MIWPGRLKKIWKTMIHRVIVLSIKALVVLSAVSSLVDWRKYPPALIMGGIVGLLHLKGVQTTARSVTRGVEAKGLLLFLSTFRLILVGAVLFVLISHAGMNPVGLLGGLITVHAVVLYAGWEDAKKSEE